MQAPILSSALAAASLATLTILVDKSSVVDQGDLKFTGPLEQVGRVVYFRDSQTLPDDRKDPIGIVVGLSADKKVRIVYYDEYGELDITRRSNSDDISLVDAYEGASTTKPVELASGVFEVPGSPNKYVTLRKKHSFGGDVLFLQGCKADGTLYTDEHLLRIDSGGVRLEDLVSVNSGIALDNTKKVKII